jgi:hypothetical protein
MTSPTDLVRLRNGAAVPRVVIKTTMIALERVASTDAIALYELVAACRDASHVLFGGYGRVLSGLGLIDVAPDGTARIHEITRDIVLSAVEGDDLTLALVSPVQVNG